MKEEFNLSERIVVAQKIVNGRLEEIEEGTIDTINVKEFIKRLKDKIDKIDLVKEASIQDYLVKAQDEVDKLAGDKLI